MLYTKTNKSLIANKDIAVYKIMVSIERPCHAEREFQSAYLYRTYPQSEMTGSYPMLPEGKEEILAPNKFCNMYRIGSGFIHAFTTKDAALDELKRYFDGHAGYYPCIIECSIPAGTEYFDGNFIGANGRTLHSYAAKSMIFKSMVCCKIKGKIYGNASEYKEPKQ